jgi:hypothetical protein
MSLIQIRKIVTSVERVSHEGGPIADTPLKVGVIAVVLRNPYAGTYVEDLLPLMAELKPLGKQLAAELLAAMAVPASAIEAYGKGSIVGAFGELEHGALWHEPGGWGMREVLGHTKAIVPSNKIVSTVGARLPFPLAHVNAAYVRSHFQTAEITIMDSPRPNELVFALGMATGPRIHARIGGLAADKIVGEDGLR